jgi:hypothetical protein
MEWMNERKSTVKSKQPKSIPIGLHVKCALLLSDFNKTWFFPTHFRKTVKYQIPQKIRPVAPGCSMLTDRQTRRSKQSSFAIMRMHLTRLTPYELQTKYYSALLKLWVQPGARAVYGANLKAPEGWDRGFESRWVYEWPSLTSCVLCS